MVHGRVCWGSWRGSLYVSWCESWCGRGHGRAAGVVWEIPVSRSQCHCQHAEESTRAPCWGWCLGRGEARTRGIKECQRSRGIKQCQRTRGIKQCQRTRGIKECQRTRGIKECQRTRGIKQCQRTHEREDDALVHVRYKYLKHPPGGTWGAAIRGGGGGGEEASPGWERGSWRGVAWCDGGVE
jgi:hypothetical protein